MALESFFLFNILVTSEHLGLLGMQQDGRWVKPSDLMGGVK